MPHHSKFQHTPFDGSQPLFKIGLRPFQNDTWLEVDHCHQDHITEKQRLLAQMTDKVFQALPETQSVQSEVKDLVCQWLKLYQPMLDHHISPDEPALLAASRLVQEDLIVLRKFDAFWHVVAGSVCFPSSWSLPDKLGLPMHEVHGPVPGFNKSTRNATMIERIFDNLQVGQPLERFNWSIYNSDALYHGDAQSEEFTLDQPCFLRSERQTLTKLATSGDILFTVRIHVDPLEALLEHKDRAQIASGLINLIKELDEDELAYKGLSNGKPFLIGKLQEMTSIA